MSAPRRKHKHGLEWHELCKREQCFLSIRAIHVTRIETKLLQKEAFATMCNYTNVLTRAMINSALFQSTFI